MDPTVVSLLQYAAVALGGIALRHFFQHRPDCFVDAAHQRTERYSGCHCDTGCPGDCPPYQVRCTTMSVPQNILDAITLVQSNADTTAASVITSATSAAAALAAQTQATTDAATVVTNKQTQATNLAAAEALLTSLYS